MKTYFFIAFIFFFYTNSIVGQYFSLHGHYIKDFQSQTNYMEANGLHLSVGIEDIFLGLSDFSLSFRGGVNIYNDPKPYIRDNIYFDLPSEYPNAGFGSIQNSKEGYSLEIDLGYDPKVGTGMMYPYLTVGLNRSIYSTSLRYDLYEVHPDLEIDYQDIQLNEFQTIGFQSGFGVKFSPLVSNRIYIDFRFLHSSAWLRNSYTYGLPDLDTFHINSYGEEQMNYHGNNFMSNLGFRVGLTINFTELKSSGYNRPTRSNNSKSSSASRTTRSSYSSGSSSRSSSGSSGGGSRSSSGSSSSGSGTTLSPSRPR